jgi:lipoprotein-releasing system ATP-binding protein
MLTTTYLSFQYGPARSFAFPDLSCAAGETLLVLGPSGCGKTTLLHLLAGLLRPQKGTVRLGNTNLTELSAARADRFRGQNIGIIYQKSHFMAALTVADNLALPNYFGGRRADPNSIRTLADTLGIGHTLRQLPARLSVGEQQRVSIARALVHRPQLVLADEPTSALDDPNCARVLQLLTTQCREQGAALIIVTHDGRLKQDISLQITL